MSAQSQVQKAFVARCKARSTLMAIVTGVFDYRGMPVGQAFPYLTVGDFTETKSAGASSFDKKAWDLTHTMHIWSRQPGMKEAQNILAELNAEFDEQPMTLDSQQSLGTWYDFSQTLGDPDDSRITHIPVRYRITAQE